MFKEIKSDEQTEEKNQIKKINSIPSKEEIEEFSQMQQLDPDIKLLREKIENEDFSYWKNGNLKKYFSTKKKFYLNSNILVWHRPYDNKILPVVSDDFMINVLITAHKDAHKGSKKLEIEVKNNYYCPGIMSKAKDITSTCYLCQTNKVQVGLGRGPQLARDHAVPDRRRSAR